MKKVSTVKLVAFAVALAMGVAATAYSVVSKVSHQKVMKAEPGGD